MTETSKENEMSDTFKPLAEQQANDLSKPAEPTGDRATVRGADGLLWTKYADERLSQFANWQNANQWWRFYKDIDVAEVLFEGVAR